MKEQALFLDLLRAGLWGTPPDPSLYHAGTEWGFLLSQAQKQTVLGIVSDGIGALPETLRPSVPYLRPIQHHLVQLRRSHTRLNEVLRTLVPQLQAASILPILLKGQGIARCYRYPEQRQCGDIDLYVGPADYAAACHILQQAGARTEDAHESCQHYHASYQGVVVELHRLAAYALDPALDTRIQRWTHHYLQEQKETCPVETIGGTEVLLPPVSFDAVYLFYHFLKHFLAIGIGFRQICDWTRYLHVHASTLDRETLAQDIRYLRLTRFWKLFGCVAVDYLGLPEAEFPFYDARYRKQAARVVELIFRCGNFGKHYFSPASVRPTGYYAGKWYAFRQRITWYAQTFSLAPREVGRFVFYSLRHGFKVALFHQ